VLQKNISRRRFVATTAAAGVSTIGLPFGTRVKAANELVFVGFGGSYQEGQTKALFEPFERETGIKIIQTSGVDLAKLRAQVQSKQVEWDLICIPDRLRSTAVLEGLLTPLDYGVIDTKDTLKHLVSEYAAGAVVTTILLTYLSKAHPPGKEPRTWADFWDLNRVPGIRGMYNAPTYTLEFALIADGVPKDKLYPLDLDRAFKSLDRIKADTKVWWSQFSQPELLLKSGEITMTPWARSISFALEGIFGISYEGAVLTYEGWVVPKGAPNTSLSMKFINWALQPKPQAELTKYIAYGPTNTKAMQYVDPKLGPLLPSAPENIKKGFQFSADWWGPNLEKTTERWNEWRIK
jgi:putative spermidine/putrescine transport system substrate-binding protein